MGYLISLSKTGTSDWLEISEYALLAFALVVVVGLIGEHKLPFWHARIKFFEVLVVIGCGGEVLADGGIFMFSRQLQVISEQEVRDAGQRAVDAQNEAWFARKDAANARKDGEQLKLGAEKLRNENLILQTDLLKLRKESEPRRLTGEQREKLTKLLTGDPGAIVIVSTLLDRESSDFADDFNMAFKNAHWETLRIVNHASRKYGVSIGTVAGTKILDTKLVSDALLAIGVSHAEVSFDSNDHTMTPWFESGVLYLVIEGKPPLTAKFSKR